MNFIINPTYDEQRDSNLNMMVVGTSEGIVMIEAGAQRGGRRPWWWTPSSSATSEIKKICAAISEFAQKVGKPKRKVEPPVIDQEYLDASPHQDRRSAWRTRSNTEKYPKIESYGIIKTLKDS